MSTTLELAFDKQVEWNHKESGKGKDISGRRNRVRADMRTLENLSGECV